MSKDLRYGVSVLGAVVLAWIVAIPLTTRKRLVGRWFPLAVVMSSTMIALSVVQAGIPKATPSGDSGPTDSRIVDHESDYRAGDICGIIPATTGKFSHPGEDTHAASEWLCTRICRGVPSNLCEERHVTRQFRVLRGAVGEFDKGGEFWINSPATQSNCNAWTKDDRGMLGTTKIVSVAGFFPSRRSCHSTLRGLCCLTENPTPSKITAASSTQAALDGLDKTNLAAPRPPEPAKEEKMSQSVIDNVWANLIAAPIIWIATLIVGLLIGTWRGNRRYRQKIDGAQEVFVRQMDGLIQRAIAEGEDSCLVNAQAIVSTRDSLRTTLGELSKYLNSDIDKISSAMSVMTQPENPSGLDDSRKKSVWHSIQVLSRTWPSKGEQVKVEVRKLLAVLAITPE